MSFDTWTEDYLANIDVEIIDGDRGKNYPKNDEFTDTGFCLFLNAKNVTKNGFSFDDNSFISEARDNSLRKGKLQRNDLVLTTRGTVGNIAYYNDKVLFENIRINSGMVILRCKQTKLLPSFFYYELKSKLFQNQIESIVTGSAQPQLPITIMKNLVCRIPPLPVQHRISAILSSLDDKIENNRKTCAKLEEIAQAIFKRWFVDFKPWNGILPSTWKIKPLNDVCKNITDGVHNTVIDDPKGEYLLLSCKNIKDGSIITGDTERTISAETFKKLRKRTQLEKGDILLSSVGTVGEMALLTDEPLNIEFQRSVAMIKPNPKFVSSSFLYEALLDKKKEIVHSAHGAVQQCLFIGDIKNLSILLPDFKPMSEYSEIVTPLFAKISSNRLENRHLSILRNILLPKLMLGELAVEEGRSRYENRRNR